MGSAEALERWATLKATWPPGRVVEGVVARHVPFGLFLDIGEGEILGLVLLTDIPIEPPVTPEELPAVGSRVRTHLLGFRNPNLQVALTLRGEPPPRPAIAPGQRVWAGGLRHGVARVVAPMSIIAVMDDTGREETFSVHDLVRDGP